MSDREEVDICASLQEGLTSPDNHTIPCDVIGSREILLVMPYLPSIGALLRVEDDWLKTLLEVTRQLLEVSCDA